MAQQSAKVPNLKEMNTQLQGKGGTAAPIYKRVGSNSGAAGKVGAGFGKKSGK